MGIFKGDSIYKNGGGGGGGGGGGWENVSDDFEIIDPNVPVKFVAYKNDKFLTMTVWVNGWGSQSSSNWWDVIKIKDSVNYSFETLFASQGSMFYDSGTIFNETHFMTISNVRQLTSYQSEVLYWPKKILLSSKSAQNCIFNFVTTVVDD